MSSIHITENYPYSDTFPCLCANCGSVLESSELEFIKDAEQRLTPGEETPAGECPHCYALAFIMTKEQATEHGVDPSRIETGHLR